MSDHQACSLGMPPYGGGGYSKLKHEFLLSNSSPGLVSSPSSRPPWALPPPLSGNNSAVAPKQDFLPQQQHQQQLVKPDRLTLLSSNNAAGGTSTAAAAAAAATGRFHELHAPPTFQAALPYEAQVNSLYKASMGSSFGGAAGGLNFGKDHQLQQQRAVSRQYPLQYNGGSLVLDHHRGELINLSKMTPQEILDAKALAASKSHSEAERRRRERINNHLNTLRGLLPSTTKTDKASLLAEVIEHVKDLKRQAAEIAEGGPVPTDVDELKVDTDPSSSDGNFILKASLCCEDRPDLLTDLTKALRTLKLKTLKAEIATLGGRVKNVLLIGKDNSNSNSNNATGVPDQSEQQDRPAVISCVQDALRAVIERSTDISTSGYGSSKRQKMNSAAAAAGSHHHESF